MCYIFNFSNRYPVGLCHRCFFSSGLYTDVYLHLHLHTRATYSKHRDISWRQVGWSALPKDTTLFGTARNPTNNLLIKRRLPNRSAIWPWPYITKAEQEMELLIQRAQNEGINGNLDAKAAFKQLGSVYLHNREVSAQEAVYRLTHMPVFPLCWFSVAARHGIRNRAVQNFRPSISSDC